MIGAWSERHWQARTMLAVALYPVSMLFRLAVAARASLYHAGVLRTTRTQVPVIVVGNVTVGGTGKTPLVAYLAAFLRERAWQPGIVSRGYGGNVTTPRAVSARDDPLDCGDEAILLARRSGCPVWVGHDRVAAVRGLLAAHPRCNIVIADDGLQHYALARDIEIAVIDGARGLGNGWLLPAGPLREPPGRLRTVDAVIANGAAASLVPLHERLYGMRLEGHEFYNLLDPRHRVGAGHFQHMRVHAIAGIGRPQRFFEHLHELGVDFIAHAFPDHHPFAPGDLVFADADAVVMTEKDAVKCERFATERYWVLPVDAVVEPALGQLVLRKLGHPDEQ